MAKKDSKSNVVDLGAKVQVIPVPVYGNNFQIRLTQRDLYKYIDTLETAGKELTKKMEAVEDDDWNQLGDYLIEAFDVILGDGAGAKIKAAESDPLLLVQTIQNVSEYLTDKFNDLKLEHDKQKAQAVIDAKKNTANAAANALQSSI